MKAALKQQTSTGLVLTPQLQNSIRLLALSHLELEQEVAQMLLDNPFLEHDEHEEGEHLIEPSELAQHEAHSAQGEAEAAAETNYDAPDAAELQNPSDWEGEGSVSGETQIMEWGQDAPSSSGNNNEDDEFDPMSLKTAHISLQDQLHEQALGLRLSRAESAALYFLIESLNDDGYLEDSLVSLAQHLAGDDFDRLEEVLSPLQVALKQLQQMEPAGVGARDLAECLRLQIQTWPDSETKAAALIICSHHLQALAKKDIRALMRGCKQSEAVVREAMAAIARLEPKPGRRFADVESLIVVPEVVVRSKGSGLQRLFTVELNPAVLPRLRVDEIYARALRQAPSGAAQQSLQEARGFVRNIQQRFDTILRTAEAIVQQQHQFFLRGPTAMKPMVLREVAEELGMHESTISRVTNQKYMATPQGTFELKYFFSSGLASTKEGRDDTSSVAVRAHIQRLIKAENKAKPLSDGKIAEILASLGIECARRTVAKYREQLRIPAVSERRER